MVIIFRSNKELREYYSSLTEDEINKRLDVIDEELIEEFNGDPYASKYLTNEQKHLLDELTRRFIKEGRTGCSTINV